MRSTEPTVITLPAQIGLANAGLVGDELFLACTCGAPVVVADMTATTTCDLMGARMLARVRQEAAAHGTDLRLAVPFAELRHTLLSSGLFLPIFPSLDAALSLWSRAGA